MNILDYSIIFFVAMELANVFILYFKPTFKYGNGIAVFDNFEESKKDEDMHTFVKYLKNWVAGTKLIFIVLLVVILILGSNLLKICAVGAMILSIATYFFGLHPLICKLDKRGKITPKKYSSTLLLMIVGFMTMFALALVLHLTLGI